MREAPLYQAMLLTSDRNVKANAGRAGNCKSSALSRTGRIGTGRMGGRRSRTGLRVFECEGMAWRR